jgi:hypothetical protein
MGCTGALKTRLYSLNVCMGQDEEMFLAKSRPSPYLLFVQFYALLVTTK